MMLSRPARLLLLIGLISVCRAFLLEDQCPDCHWNGECDSRHGRCSCYDGFTGPDCSIDCGCQGHGHCNSDHTCLCDSGWKWSATQHRCVWDCTCANGAQCMGPGICGCTHACYYGTCWHGQCECWEGYKGRHCDQYDQTLMMNYGVNFGVNLNGLSYWSPELKFVDVCKQSQEWITERSDGNAWDTHEHDNVTWSADGYPLALDKTLRVGKLVLRDAAGLHAPQGNFTILYDGEGTLTFKLLRYTVHHNGKGRMVVEFHEQSGGIFILITRTNPSNPLRNLRVILPGFEDRYDSFPFYPPFVESIKRYSEIRFMDFFNTNGHTPEPTTWSTRRSKQFHTQTGTKGATIEYALELANLVGADPWFNMPHAADDDFIQRFAEMTKLRLRPDRKVFIEYSNEVWNGIFRQTHYTQERGLAAGLDTQAWKAGMKYYNQRATEISDIWRNVFNAASNRTLVPVWAWQTGYQDYTRQALVDLGSRISHFGAIGVTGYFDCDRAPYKHNITSMTFDQIAQLCKNEVPKSEASFQHYLDVAKSHNVKLLMYEGGPGLESSAQHDDQVTDKAIFFNRHGLMELAVSDVLEAWYNVTNTGTYNSGPGGMFNYFSSMSSFSKYGSWGMMEYTGQDPYTAPKYLAVHKFISRHYNDRFYGPSCTFVQSGGETFGCFRQNSHLWCGHSSNNGSSWQHYPALNPTAKVNILDGYDPLTHDLFVRSIDSLAVNTYLILNSTTTPHAWQNVTFSDYNRQLAPGSVLRHQPVGVAAVDLTHLNC